MSKNEIMNGQQGGNNKKVINQKFANIDFAEGLSDSFVVPQSVQVKDENQQQQHNKDKVNDIQNEFNVINDNDNCIERYPQRKRTILESNLSEADSNSLSDFELLKTKTNFFSNKNSNANEPIQQEQHEYLKPYAFPDISMQTYFNLKATYYDKEFFSQTWTSFTKDKEIKSLFAKHTNINTIGPFHSFQHYLHLINNTSNNVLNKPAFQKAFTNLKGTFAFWRKVKGDGNCFYRAVILRYIEQLIISNNKSALKLLLCDIYLNLSHDEMKTYLKVTKDIIITADLVTQNLFMIIYLMRKAKVADAFMYFTYCINTLSAFDYGLILYFRYKIKQYIQQNEKNYFSKDFDVLIGTLLPEQYGIENNFLFELFYSDFLLRNFIDAEKIVIYIVPYLLQVKINVIVNDDGFEGESNKLLVFDCAESEKDNKKEMTLVMRKNHFDIGYTEEEGKMFNEVYRNYNAILMEIPKEVKQICNELMHKEGDKKGNKELKQSKTVVKEEMVHDSKVSSNENKVNNKSTDSYRLLETQSDLHNLANEQSVVVSGKKEEQGVHNANNNININNSQRNVNNSNKGSKIDTGSSSHKESIIKNEKKADNAGAQPKSQSVVSNHHQSKNEVNVNNNNNSSNSNNSHISNSNISSSHCKQILQLREQKEKQQTQKCTECQKEYHLPPSDIFHICSKCFYNKIVSCYEQSYNIISGGNKDVNDIRDKLIFNFDNGSTSINGMITYYISYPNIDTTATKLHDDCMKHIQKKMQLHQSTFVKK